MRWQKSRLDYQAAYKISSPWIAVGLLTDDYVLVAGTNRTPSTETPSLRPSRGSSITNWATIHTHKFYRLDYIQQLPHLTRPANSFTGLDSFSADLPHRLRAVS